jgi:dynein heavy chain
VLLKQVFKKAGQWQLRLGNDDVPYNEDFAFYITTKMSNPHYLPEICIKVTVINFTVTLIGLEDQLAAEVVASERADLSALRANLVVQIAADKAEMDRLEQLILKLLTEAGNDLLADDKLIVTLDQSKQTGDGCKERMGSAEISMQEIDEVTEAFRPVATRASIIYFVVADLAAMDPMYQYSLQFFAGLFQARLQASEKNEKVDKRIDIVLKDFTEFIYVNICRGLFEDHKLLFSFLITAQLLRHKTHCRFLNRRPIANSEWQFFLRSLEAAKGILEDLEEEAPGRPDWLQPPAWRKLDVLERLTSADHIENYSGLCNDIQCNPEWQTFAQDDRMYERELPSPWHKKLSAFQQMLIVKSLRENLLQLVVRKFVAAELGDMYTVSPAFDLKGCFQDSQKTIPLIFVLSSGADPTDALLKLASEYDYTERLHLISLGQGQGPKAEKLMQLGRSSGDWVCLQNCHLAASWMPALERIQEAQDPDQIDSMYRLWLTSMPSPTFPVPVLQGGIKITNEPPKGLRANLARTFQDISDETYEGCSMPREFKKLLFALAFFHAAILERRKFGPIGWNIPYEWMDSDFQVSREQVHMYLESQPGVPWLTLNYIIAEVNYGGRVTDDKDVRLISAFLYRYFNEGVLEDGYKLSPLEAYYAPKEGSLTEVREFIHQLPLDEDPQVFGLHSNALITAQTQSAKKFLDTTLSVQPRLAGGGAGKKPEDIAAEMALGFTERLPKLKNGEAFRNQDAHPETYKTTPEGGIVSLGVFHKQEADRFSALINVMEKTLSLLAKAIKGLVVMSAQLEDMFHAFTLQRLPPVWEAVAYPCLKPLNSWFCDFEQRVACMDRWLRKGPPNSFWVPCFYFPQGFMTASMQVYARSTKIPIDTLTFWTEPTGFAEEEHAPAQECGVNVHGLFLQGAGWSLASKAIAESEPAVLFKQLPVIWLNPLLRDDFLSSEKEPGRYKCPLYKTSERRGTLSTTGHSTNFVTYLYLPSHEQDQGHWVRRGVAMVCMLDD